MPVLQNAALLAVGTVINLEDAPEFADGKPTGRSEGVKALVATGDGYVEVKLRHDVAAEVRPIVGQTVCWLVRFGASGGGDRDARAWTSFVRVATPGDLERIAAVTNRPAAKAA